MSCFYDVRQSEASPVSYIDAFAAVYDALEKDISCGRVVVDPGENKGNVIVFCTEEAATEMPSDISEKLSKAWFKISIGPYEVQTENRVLEPTDHWRERSMHLVC